MSNMRKLFILVLLIALMVGATLLAMNKPRAQKKPINRNDTVIQESSKKRLAQDPVVIPPKESKSIEPMQAEPPLDPYLVAKGVVHTKYPNDFENQWRCLDFYIEFFGEWGTAEQVQAQIDFLTNKYASFCHAWNFVNGTDIRREQVWYIDIHKAH